MAQKIEVKVPDIGDFKNVEIIDVLVQAGDTIEKESPLITLETDKAAMDVPAPQAGKIVELKVGNGDKVSEGDVIAVLEVSEGAAGSKAEKKAEAAKPEAKKEEGRRGKGEETKQGKAKPASPTSVGDDYSGKVDVETEVLVLGAGPGGYTAAFRAADLGLKVTLVERWDSLGGVCLNVGCIPSKALLHAAKVIDEAAEMEKHGISFGAPAIDAKKLVGWKSDVVKKLTGGLATMAKQRKVNVVNGYGKFIGRHHVEVDTDGRKQVVRFEKCIIAAGSEPVRLPFAPEDERVMDSTGALELNDIPKKLLVIGGGIIGLEMACVYDALGSEVTVVELADQLVPGADKDLIRPLEKRIKARYANIMTGTKVTEMKAEKNGIKVSFEGKSAAEPQLFDRVLVAVGRVPNGKKIDADKAGVAVDERGFIQVDKQQRTNVEHIFAIGDIVGQPMLAHKATHEGKVAAEVCAGEKRYFDARVIPSVAYTDPEVAWVGLTEEQAKQDSVEYELGKFPWAASGRSLSVGRDEGFTKLLFDPKTQRVLGGAMVGPNAGELIAEVALAIEMGCDAADIGLTVHPHPTLSETVCFAAEAFEGTLTDLYLPKRKH